jgi:hypothetical protein
VRGLLKREGKVGDEIEALRRKYAGTPPPVRAPGPMVGRRDPGTSAIAAQKVRGKLAESEGLIMAVLNHAGSPVTACQIADRLRFKVCRGEVRDYGWWRLEVSRRMRGLQRMGQVMEGPSMRCPVAGSIQATWSRDPRRDRKIRHWQDRD